MEGKMRLSLLTMQFVATLGIWHSVWCSFSWLVSLSFRSVNKGLGIFLFFFFPSKLIPLLPTKHQGESTKLLYTPKRLKEQTEYSSSKRVFQAQTACGPLYGGTHLWNTDVVARHEYGTSSGTWEGAWATQMETEEKWRVAWQGWRRGNYRRTSIDDDDNPNLSLTFDWHSEKAKTFQTSSQQWINLRINPKETLLSWR